MTALWTKIILLVLFIINTVPVFSSPKLLLYEPFDSGIRTSGAMATGGTFTDGKSGKAFKSSSDSEFVEFPTRSGIKASSGTIEMWVMLLEIPAQGLSLPLFDMVGNPAWYNRICLQIGSENTNIILSANLVSDKEATKDFGYLYPDNVVKSSVNWKPGEWHHVAFSWENVSTSNRSNGNAVLRLYYDGMEIASQDTKIAAITSLPDKFKVGAVFADWCGAGGSRNVVVIDDLKTWDKAIIPDPNMVSSILPDNLRQSCISANKLINAPDIDGVINKNEWAGAAQLKYFSNFINPNRILADRQTDAWVCWDNERMYVSWICETDGKPIIGDNRNRDDSGVWKDDSIEIVFVPDASNKIYHFIGNAWGSIYDEMIDITDQGVNWNAPWIYKATRFADKWAGELSFSYKDLGIVPPGINDHWFFNICRNAVEPRELSSWSYTPKGFTDISGMGEIVFTDKQPCISEISNEDFAVGPNNIKLLISNPGSSASTVDIRTATGSRNTTGKSAGWTVQLPSASEKEFSFNVELPEVQQANLSVELADHNTGSILWRQLLSCSPKPPLSINTQNFFYRGYVEAKLDASLMKIKPVVGKVVVYKASGIKTSIAKSFKLSDAAGQVRIPTRSLPANKDYQFVFSVYDKHNKQLASKKLKITVYGNPGKFEPAVGVTNKVIFPWTPMGYKNGKVSCWNRVYDFTKSILPQSIVTRNEQVLASPVEILIESNGKAVKLKSKKVLLKQNKAEAVKLTGGYTSDLLDINVTATGEYDGMFRFDLSFNPKHVLKVDKLTLRIPIKSENAKYLQFNNGIGAESGACVIGQNGWEWKRKFMPMLWFGDDDRGLCWFAESDQGWKPYDRLDTVHIRKIGNVVELNVNILKNTQLAKPLKLTFGLQATPVKSVEKSRKRLHIYHWEGGPLHPDPNYKYNMFATPEELVAEDVGTVVMHMYWSKYACYTEPAYPVDFKRYVKSLHDKGIDVVVYFALLPSTISPEIKYFGLDWMSFPTGIWPEGQRENWRPEMQCVSICHNAPEFADRTLSGMKHLIKEYGIDGIYFDCGLFFCRNYMHGCGYQSDNASDVGNENGIIGVKSIKSSYDDTRKYRKTYEIFNARDFHKRVYTLFKSIKPDSTIIFHMSQFMAIPIMGWSDTTYDGEYIACAMPKGWIPTPEEFRAQLLREQFGVDGYYLVYDGYGVGYSTQEALAFTLIHNQWVNIRGMATDNGCRKVLSDLWNAMDSFGTDDSQWLPYYKNTEYAKTLQKDSYVSIWKHPKNGVLAVISNLSQQPQNVDTQFNLIKLGLNANNVACTDAITGEKVSMTDSKIKFNLPRLGWWLVRIQ